MAMIVKRKKNKKSLIKRAQCIYKCGNEVREAGMECRQCRRQGKRLAAKADYRQRKAQRKEMKVTAMPSHDEQVDAMHEMDAAQAIARVQS